jgi:hypothetical protein
MKHARIPQHGSPKAFNVWTVVLLVVTLCYLGDHIASYFMHHHLSQVTGNVAQVVK